MAKGRAIGYSDFYKNNDRTPGSSYGSNDDEEENGRSLGINISFGNKKLKPDAEEIDSVADRKKAIKRRLKRVRKM